MSILRPLSDVQSDSDLQSIFEWIDKIPLTRPKKNINRDFSDGVMMAEVVSYFYPKQVELHNYPPSSNLQQKILNWQTLNRRVFKRLGFVLSDRDVDDASKAQPGAIERILYFVKPRLPSVPGQQFSSKLEISSVPKQSVSPRDASALEREVENLREVVEILTEKNRKLEQLVHIKDMKIQSLQEKLELNGIVVSRNSSAK